MPALVYWFAGLQLRAGDAITIGTLVAFTTLQTRLFFPVGQLLGVGVDIQTSLALFDRIFEYLDLPVDIAERPERASSSTSSRGEVAFERRLLPLRRRRRRGRCATSTSTVPAGTRTALVGETGAGQDHARLPRRAALRRPSAAAVTIDGVDVRDLTLRLARRHRRRRLAGDLPLPRHVRENLRFARPDATDEEIEDAARAAQIHDLIASLPEGYDTVVGERGYRFSGGEKQRIAIARTVLRNPPMLVLDEATSALDTADRARVQEALERLAEGRTTIAIAHRLSTVRDADQIVVLDGGRVVERGDARRAARPAAGATRARRAGRGDHDREAAGAPLD